MRALPQAAAHAAEQAAAVLLDAVAVVAAALPDAEVAVVAALPDAAEEVGAAPAEGAPVAEPAVPGAPAGLPLALVSRQDPLPPWPAPRPWVQIARAMELSPIAWL